MIFCFKKTDFIQVKLIKTICDKYLIKKGSTVNQIK